MAHLKKRTHRWAPWALSALVHVGAFLWLQHHAASLPAQLAPRRSTAPISVTVVRKVQPAPSRPVVSPPPPTRSTARSSVQPAPTREPVVVADRPSSAAPQVGSHRLLPPLAPKIAPGDVGVPVPVDPHGHLVHNRPEELPSAEQVAAAERAEVKKRTEGWANDVLADRRVSNGLVNPYFSQVQEALAGASKSPPPFPVANVLPGAVTSYLRDMESYGRTGAPASSSDGSHPRLQEFAELQTGRPGPAGSPQGQANAAQMMAVAKNLLRSPPGVTAIVELFQQADGKLESIRLVASSGSPAFDAFVLGSAKTALQKVSRPKAEGAGVHLEGMHSVWAFTGNRILMKNVRKMKTQDIPYAVAAGAVATLTTGLSFDAAEGIEIPDIRNPSYTCRVELLRVY